MPDAENVKRDPERCSVDTLEANVDPPDRTPDSYRRAFANCPNGCEDSHDCIGHRKWKL